MPREVDDCSFICDCGHRSDFFERTIRDLKQMSLRREERLGDALGKNSHTIVFKGGRMVRIICPHKGRATARKGAKASGSVKTSTEANAAKGKTEPKIKIKLKNRPKPPQPSAKLTTAELDELIEEATVDCYDTEEQVSGFFNMLDEDLKLPFETTVLGVAAIVETIEQTENNDIVVVCRAGKNHQRIRVVDLPLPKPEPKGAKWIAAYRHWLREGGATGDDEE